MARLGRFVVRVLLTKEQSDKLGPFLEQLRYAGLIHMHSAPGDEEDFFDILPPDGLERNEAWRYQNAMRMQSFGYDARGTVEHLPGDPPVQRSVN